MSVNLDTTYLHVSQHLGYTFKERTLLQQALSHRSRGRINNERLEFLGDAILDAVVSHALWQKFPQADEGQLSRLRARLVCGEHLRHIAQNLQLQLFVQVGDSEKTTALTGSSILADTLEALIGAIYLEAGYTVATTVILRWFEAALVALTLTDGAKDPKTTLQEYLQAQQAPLPVYEVIAMRGPEHQQEFEVACTGSLWVPQVGCGSSRRRAEQAAALKVLALLT